MLSEGLSELIGVVVGDGCLSKFFSKSKNKTIFLVSITGSWDNDSEYYKQVIQPILVKEFGLKGYIYHRKDGTIRFFIESKRVFDFLNKCGVPVGEKIRIKTTKEILNNKKSMRGFVRGLFNTDGTVYRRYSKPYGDHKKHYKNYGVIQLKMINKNIIEFTRDILKKLGLNVTKITKEYKKYYLFRVTSQEDVDKFFKILKINHPYHLKRYNEIRFSS